MCSCMSVRQVVNFILFLVLSPNIRIVRILILVNVHLFNYALRRMSNLLHSRTHHEKVQKNNDYDEFIGQTSILSNVTNRACTRLVTTYTLPAASLIAVTYLYEKKQAVRN